MLEKLIAEVTEYDFKSAVETNKPKSWLKSVSAFANGIGGTLFFGVENDGTVNKGLFNPQKDAEAISRLIQTRIIPMPEINLKAVEEKGHKILCLIVKTGRNTPYYYSADGIKQAYVRIGNDSVPAPEDILNELILKGQNKTYDSSDTEFKKEDYSFTLMEATYRQRTNLKFESTDYHSFGLVNPNGMLTVAGALLADQHIIYNSRVFCTRWNGLIKGSIYDDAIDDKEYEGNLIHLLNSSCDFIKNNSKVRFEKQARYRVDKPDYAERAVTEVMVNALIHRNYVSPGTEIHIDMFDDRVEITSPGGMFEGGVIQNKDLSAITSARRNPIIADLFHRMKFMERRGSGLRKIMEETAKLPGYAENFKPEFSSTPSNFKVTLKNLNYGISEEKVSIENEKPSFESEKVSIENEKTIIERLNDTELTEHTKQNIITIYNEFKDGVIFGRSDVCNASGLGITAAGNLLHKLCDAELITPVTGHGKGKYKFII